MTPRTVPEDRAVTVTARGPLSHQCPHVDEDDHGTVSVTWTAGLAVVVTSPHAVLRQPDRV